MNEFSTNKSMDRRVLGAALVVAVILFIFVLSQGWDGVVNNEIDGIVTVTGSFSCLPLTDPTVPEDECALGLKSRDGSYYALDVSRIQDANTDLKAEDTIAATGTFAPLDSISASDWSQYDIERIIRVHTLLRTR